MNVFHQPQSRISSFYDDSPEHTELKAHRKFNSVDFTQQYENMIVSWNNNYNKTSVQPLFTPSSEDNSFRHQDQEASYPTSNIRNNETASAAYDWNAKANSPCSVLSQHSQTLEPSCNSFQFIPCSVDKYTDTKWTMSELSKSPHHLSSSQESMILIENPPFRWQDKAFGHKTKPRDMSIHCETPRYTNNDMTLQMA